MGARPCSSIREWRFCSDALTTPGLSRFDISRQQKVEKKGVFVKDVIDTEMGWKGVWKRKDGEDKTVGRKRMVKGSD